MLPHQRPYGSRKKSRQAKPSLLHNHTPSFRCSLPWTTPAVLSLQSLAAAAVRWYIKESLAAAVRKATPDRLPPGAAVS